MGADYKKALKSILPFSSGTNVAANAAFYFCVGDVSGTATLIRIIITTAGVLSRMYTYSGVAPGAGETFDYTVMINGLEVALATQHAGAVQRTDSDLVDQIAVVPEDEINIRIVTSLNAAVTRHQATLEFKS